MRKTWQEKFDTRKAPELKRVEKDFDDIKAGELMLISTPADIARYISAIPSSQTKSLQQMRKALATEKHADKTCPVTSGIFTRIVAERSLELMTAGKEPIAPFWRLIDPGSPIANKLSCGPEFITEMLEKEAIT